MSGLIYYTDKRRIVPQIERANEFKETRITLNLNNNQTPEIIFNNDNIQSRIELWRKNKNLNLAGEIISLAIIKGKIDEVKEIREYIEEHSTNDPIYDSIFKKKKILTNNSDRIKNNREKLLLEPKDAVTWTDQSINYLELGNREKALKCIEVAVSIEKNIGFVLRNASRIFNLCGDNDRAISLLKKSEYYKYDPQILSAEIAFSQLEDRKTKGIDFARKILLDAKYNDHEISELASAVGTFEFFKGDFKQSEKLFDISLRDPTTNSLAQSLWYKRNDTSFFIKDVRTDLFSNEIETHRKSKINDFSLAYEFAKKWIKEESYSKRPYNLAAHLGGVLLDKNEEAAQFSIETYNKQRLIKGELNEEEEFSHRNDIAYFLLRAGKVEAAHRQLLPFFKMLRNSKQHKRSENFYLATLGLYMYKVGEIELGRKLYKQSIRSFIELKEKYNAKVAFFNFFSEEIKIKKSEDEKIKLIKELQNFISDDSENDLIFLRNKELTKNQI